MYLLFSLHVPVLMGLLVDLCKVHRTHLPVQELETLIMSLQHFWGAATTSCHSSVLACLSETLASLLFPAIWRENEASHSQLSLTLTPDILLQSDNLLHTPQSKWYQRFLLTKAKLWLKSEKVHITLCLVSNNKYTSICYSWGFYANLLNMARWKRSVNIHKLLIF